jgi:hypothetical protein
MEGSLMLLGKSDALIVVRKWSNVHRAKGSTEGQLSLDEVVILTLREDI